MFQSLKHWIDSITNEGKLFRDVDDERLHSALASLLYHFIALDARHDGKEKHEFDRIMKQELHLSQEQVDHLYRTAHSATGNLHDDLQTIRAHLSESPTIRMRFLQKLLQLVDIHGAHPAELNLFYETLHEVFPGLDSMQDQWD